MNLNKEIARAKVWNEIKKECFENNNYDGGYHADNEYRKIVNAIKKYTGWDNIQYMLKELEA